MNRDEIRVMVTGVGGGGNGEQLVKALRLARTNYRIIGADITPLSKGLFLTDERVILPPATAPEYLDNLMRVCREKRIDVLLTGSEPELKRIAAVQDEIRAAGVFLPMNPQSVIERCMDKAKTMAFLAENGFSYPETVPVRGVADLARVRAFPVVLKPSIGGGGSANTFIAQSPDELRLFGEWMLRAYPEFIVQRYVGNAGCEYTVGVLCGMDGALINSIAVKKNILSALSCRMKIKSRFSDELLVISSGITQGAIGRYPDVTAQCEAIALALGARSAINIQLRFVDGKAVIFEINPRYSGTSSFRAIVGYNEPDVMIRKHLLGETIEPGFPYEEGVILRGLDEVFVPAKELSGLGE